MFDEILDIHTPNQGREIINENFSRVNDIYNSTGIVEVEQVSHGLTVGQFIYSNGNAYVLADSSSHLEARVVGVVSEVMDADNFRYTAFGIVELFTSLTAGAVYYLSTGGNYSATPGTIVKPVFLYLGEGQSLLLQNEARTALDFAQPILAASFNDTASTYFVAPEDMTLGDAVERGAGTVTYHVGQAGATAEDDDFVPATLPVELTAGEILRVFVDEDIGDFKTVTLRRLA